MEASGNAVLYRVMSTATDRLSADDLEFLARPLHGFLTTAAGPRPPQPRPVWFEATAEGTIQMFTGPDTVKIRRLRRDPRASIVVATPTSEREGWVSATGPTTVKTDGAHDLAARLADRYWNLNDPARAAELAAMLEDDWLRIVLRPENVRRFAF